MSQRPSTTIAVGAIGMVGTGLVAAGSYDAGSMALVTLPGAPTVGHNALAGWLAVAGLVVVSACWLVLGRLVLDPTRRMPWHQVGWVAAAWSLPIMFAAPIASRDVWAYGGQAEVYRHGLDPYRVGPSGFASHYLPYVSFQWRDETSPYGPVWLPIAALVVSVTGAHLLATVFTIRVLCAVAFAAIVLTLPRLARTFGGSPATATWLFCANPVLVVITLGGPHNDLLMAGLLAAGLWLAVAPGPLWRSLVLAAVVLTVAALIKLPAAAALAFLPYVWLRYAASASGWRKRHAAVWKVSGIVVLVAAATAAVITAATGLGLGWTHQLNTGQSGVLWLSVPVVVGYLWSLVRGGGTGFRFVSEDYPNVISAVSAMLALALVALWLAGRRYPPARLLAVALLVGVLASTTVQPWYAAWALLLVAAVVTDRGGIIVAAAISVWATLCMGADGSSHLATLAGVPIAVGSALASWLLLRSPAPVTHPSVINSSESTP